MPYLKEYQHSFVSASTTELSIAENSYNETVLTAFCISVGSIVRHITIGNKSLQFVRRFELLGLNKLESLVIESLSCTQSTGIKNITIWNDSVCRIVDCPNLVSIRFGEYSMSGYKSLELRGLDSLQSIDMNLCFCFAEECTLKSENYLPST